METICMQCGDKGFFNAMIFCVKCLDVAVHRYCLDKFPQTFDEFVHWVCDDCEVNVLHKLTSLRSEPIQLERREHRSTKDVGSCRGELKKRKISNSVLDSLHVNLEVELTENAQSTSESPPSKLKQKTDGATIFTSGTNEQKSQSSSYLQLDDTNDEVHSQHASEIDAVKKMENKEKSSRNCSLLEDVKQRLVSSPSEKPFEADTRSGLDEHAQVISSTLQEELEDQEATLSAAKMEVHGCQHLEPPNIELGVMEVSSLMRRDVNCLSSDLSDQGLKRSETTHLVPGHLSNNLIFDNHERARPLIDPIWRGSFNILNKDYEAFDGLVAHLSSKACQKVCAEASMVPSLLDLEMNPKSQLWPKSFETSEPSDDNIALYFFPMGKRYERMFDYLVEEMTSKELAMRAVVKNAELLVFTSTELPLSYWRFQGKYYLWGVFRGKKASPAVDSPVELRNGEKHEKSKSWDADSPLSPLSNSLSFGLGNL